MIFKKVIFIFLLINISLGKQAVANSCGSFADNFNAPVCTDAKYIFWTGAAITTGLLFFKKSFIEEVQNRATSKDHLKQWGAFGGDVGYGYLNGIYFFGQLAFGGKNGNRRAEHMLEASIYTLGTTMILKKSIHESRPGYPDDPDSFPSGHASFAFAFASVVTANHGWFYGGISHLVATFISYSRMDENWHYLHDVIFGATIGMSYGWGIYYNHKEHNKPYWFAAVPTPDVKGLMLTYAYKF